MAKKASRKANFASSAPPPPPPPHRCSGEYYKESPEEWQKDVPHTIYFYYAVPAGRRKYDVRAYIWVNPDNKPIKRGRDLRRLIARLTTNARGKDKDPRPIGTGFTVPWWKKSYIVIALDELNGFRHDKAIKIIRLHGDKSANHCFFDGWDGMMLDSKGRPMSVMWTINHMRGEDGANIASGAVHEFILRFNPDENRSEDDRDDDHGTNMGPPIGPP